MTLMTLKLHVTIREGEPQHTRRRIKYLPSPVKINAEMLDNRYTDVVSLQCKVHESQTPKLLIFNF